MVSSMDDAAQLLSMANNSMSKFRGQMPELERAIGMLFVGRQFGWKVIYLTHSKSTVRKYEDILGIKVREFFPEVGPLARRSVGWKIAEKVTNFWKEVSGNDHGARNAELAEE